MTARDLPKKILVPNDFSEESLLALRLASTWAQRTGGEVSLLHVIPSANWHVLGEPSLRSDTRTAAVRKLRALQVQELGPGESEVFVVEGVPHAEIVRFAANRGIEMIAIASRGQSGIQRFFLGSTAERVVRTATCSVLVARERGAEDGKAPGFAPGDTDRILAATDLTSREDHAVDTAVRFARIDDAELLLTHVLDDDDHPSYNVISQERWARVRRAAERELVQMQRNLCGESVRSRILLLDGVPSTAINAAALKNDVDLIVVGPQSGESHLLGATAERVVRGAPCSVFVARPAPE